MVTRVNMGMEMPIHAKRRMLNMGSLQRLFLVHFVGAALILGGPSLVCCEAQQANSNTQGRIIVGAAPPLVISAGDLIQLDVFDTPELSGKIRVSQTGEIKLPVGGTLLVEGKTPIQVGALIEHQLVDQNILKSFRPINVFVSEYATQGVSVLGQVRSPGVYPLLGSHRLYELISAAGGFSDLAGNQISILHQDSNIPTTVVKVDQEHLHDADLSIFPGDTILVSKAGVVYVLGDVGRPGGFVIQDTQPLTILKALSLAQGINKTAKLGATRIIRETANGKVEVPVHLSKVLNGKEPDLALTDRDILFIPSSLAKTLGYRGIELGAQTATGVLIYK